MTEMLTEAEVAAVQEILSEELEVGRAQLTPEARLEMDLGADSLTRVNIVMRLEERFNVTLPDEAVEEVETIGDLFEALAKALGR